MSAKEVESIEIYEQGNVEFRVYRYTDPDLNDCWLKIGGCCGLQFRDKEFKNLLDVIETYRKESTRRKRLWNKITWKLGRQD